MCADSLLAGLHVSTALAPDSASRPLRSAGPTSDVKGKSNNARCVIDNLHGRCGVWSGHVVRQCTRNKNNRTLTREENEPLMEPTARRAEAQPQKMKLSKQLCEHPFGSLPPSGFFSASKRVTRPIRRTCVAGGSTPDTHDLGSSAGA